ncbi:MAG: tRNA uridine-5-carboxymethylaminomethyl(34) synthesis GTPase MnmE [Bdellovibrionaceae bacterium]|nr:tRNA uridine-5-carboxymethylaminomethyl(34) synthesis GTPase MnmE [Pseudobdellovibrionaceae bacterium]
MPGLNYFQEDTIASLSSSLGGAIALIRISGPEAFSSFKKRLKNLKSSPKPNQAYFGKLFDDEGALIDEVVWTYYQNPKSFTGEDLVEVGFHGSSFIAEKILSSFFKEGVRQALPGEFSFRAVKNGKLSLTEAQAIPDLIESKNQQAHEIAIEKLSGTQNQLIQSLSNDLRDLAMLGEVGIDFSDQEVEQLSLPHLKEKTKVIIRSLAKLEASFAKGQLIQEGIPVAFVGLPNAGKSSFFNALLGQDRSIVSGIAGTTRDIVRETLTLASHRQSYTFRLEDTAGLRNLTSDEIEKIGMERTRQSVENAFLVLLVIDSSDSFESLKEIWSELGKPYQKTIGILTKSDLKDSMKRRELDFFQVESWVQTSSITGDGLSQAIDQMIQFADKSLSKQKGEVILTRLDHLKAVQKTLIALRAGLEATCEDLFASDVRHALHALAPLIGETLSDDLLAKIFSDFCIGK